MNKSEDVRERIAAVQHEIWAHWMRYLFDVCDMDDSCIGIVSIIPAEKVRRWQRQMNTAYADLSEKERESDREQADKVLIVLNMQPPSASPTIPRSLDPAPYIGDVWGYEVQP